MRPETVYAVSEGRKFNTDTTLVVVECYSCKIKYAIPESLKRAAIKYPGKTENGWWLSCPLGHSWGYTGQSIEEKLADAQRREQATRDLLAAEERSHAATRGHVVRQAKRAAAGVCPCCNRTFQQLARHMKAKHGGEFYILGATRLHRAWGWRLKNGDDARSSCGHARGPVYSAAVIETALPKCKNCFGDSA